MLLAAAAELAVGRTVYLMPMGHGLDQFLANRLTRMHVLQVVTDPAKADTIITDQVGAPLGGQLNDLYPPPAPPKPRKRPRKADKEKPETSPHARGLANLAAGRYRQQGRQSRRHGCLGPRPRDNFPGGCEVPPGALVGLREAQELPVRTSWTTPPSAS